MLGTLDWLGPVGARVSDALGEIAGLFTSPEQRTHWLFLATAALVAVALLLGRRGRERGWMGWRELTRRLRSPSARVDYLLILARPITGSLLTLPWIFSAYVVARGTVGVLDDNFGYRALSDIDPLLLSAAYTLVLFLAWDFSRFFVHWCMHRFPLLWAFHQVHHSAEVLTPLTLYRVHPVESLLYRLRGALVTGVVTGAFFHLTRGEVGALELLGVNALGVVFSAIGGNLRHSHLWWGWGRLERWFISPAQHQLHHARDARGSRVNYGTWLAIWDRMFSTLATSSGELPPRFGLAEADRNHRPDRWLSALFDPLWAAGARLRALVGRRFGARVAAGSLVALAPALGLAAPPAEDAPVEDAPVEDAPPSPSEDLPIVDIQPPPERGAPPPDATAPPRDEAPEVEAPEDEGPDLDLSDLDAEAEDEGPDLDLGDLDAEAEDEAPDEGAPDLDPGEPEPEPEASEEPAEAPAPAIPDADIRTDTISIIGTASEIPRVVGSAHVIDEDDLERSEPDDIHRVLERVPGVYVRNEDGFGLRPNIGLRGVDPNRSAKVVLLEDGVLLGPAPYAAPAAYYFPLTTRLVGVEVFKGPAALRHGPNTIAGAINLQTRPIPAKPAGGLDLAAGLRGYGKAHGWWGRSWKYGGLLLEGAHVQSGGFKQLDGTEPSWAPILTGYGTGFTRNEVDVKGRVNTRPGGRIYHQLDLEAGFSTERSNETYLGLSPEDFEATPYRRYAASQLGLMRWWRSKGQVSYRMFALDDLVELRVTGYRHDFSRAWRKFNSFNGGPDIREILADEGGQASAYLPILRGEQDSLTDTELLLIGTNDRRYVSQGIQTTLTLRPRTRVVDQTIEIGARIHHDWIERDHTEDPYRMTRGVLVPEGGDTITTTQNRGEVLAGAFHLYDAIDILDRLTVSPGLRLELIDAQFENRLADTRQRSFDPVWLPGIGAHVVATEWLGIFGGVHSGFSPVSPGQPDEVRPERSVNYELGLRGNFDGIVRAEAVGFYSDYSNLTGECTFAQGCDDENIGQQFNGGEVQVAGTELSLAYTGRFRRGAWIDAEGNYSFTWNRFQRDFDSSNPQWGQVEAGDALPYVPLHNFSLQLAGGMRRFALHAIVHYNGAMRDVPGQGPIPADERIPAYVTLDAGARVWVTPRASIYLNGINLTAARYVVSARPFGLRPGRPLAAMLGFKYDFG